MQPEDIKRLESLEKLIETETPGGDKYLTLIQTLDYIDGVYSTSGVDYVFHEAGYFRTRNF
jgi:hypothetical protein